MTAPQRVDCMSEDLTGAEQAGFGGCVRKAFKIVAIGGLAISLISLAGTLAAGKGVSRLSLLAIMVFGTDVFRDVRGSGPPALLVYGLSFALIIGTAASTGHWILAAVIVGTWGTIRLGSWYWRTRSRRQQTAAATEAAQ